MNNNVIQDRNEALLSLDETKIKDYCKKYKISIPESEEVFWAGVHKAICNMFLEYDTPVTSAQFNKSYEWLLDHGYDPNAR